MTNLSSLIFALKYLGLAKEASLIKLSWGSEQEWCNAFKAILSGNEKVISPTKAAMDQHDSSGNSEKYNSVLETAFNEQDKQIILDKIDSFAQKHKEQWSKQDSGQSYNQPPKSEETFEEWCERTKYDSPDEWATEFNQRSKAHWGDTDQPGDFGDSFTEADSHLQLDFGTLTLDRALSELNLDKEILIKLSNALSEQLKRVIAVTEEWGKHLDILNNFYYWERIKRLSGMGMTSGSGSKAARNQLTDGSMMFYAAWSFEDLDEIIADYKDNPSLGYDFLFDSLKGLLTLKDVPSVGSGDTPYFVINCFQDGGWTSSVKMAQLMFSLIKSGRIHSDPRQRDFYNLSPEVRQVIIESGLKEYIDYLPRNRKK